MDIEQFFSEGNYLAVFGSAVYLPRQANDIDAKIFLHNGIVDRTLIGEFIKKEFGDLPLDIAGPAGRVFDDFYSISHLPKNDYVLAGCYLTGRFYPDEAFLTNHYRSAFGPEFQKKIWLDLATDVLSFPLRGVREGKREKDLVMMLAATKKAFQNNSYVAQLMGRCASQHSDARRDLATNKIGILDFDRKIEQTIQDLLYEVRSHIPNHSKTL